MKFWNGPFCKLRTRYHSSILILKWQNYKDGTRKSNLLVIIGPTVHKKSILYWWKSEWYKHNENNFSDRKMARYRNLSKGHVNCNLFPSTPAGQAMILCHVLTPPGSTIHRDNRNDRVGEFRAPTDGLILIIFLFRVLICMMQPGSTNR